MIKQSLLFGWVSCFALCILMSPAIADSGAPTVGTYDTSSQAAGKLEASLRNDSSRAMTDLRRNDPTFAPLVAYLQTLIDGNKYDEIARIINNLRRGSNLQQDVCTFFAEKKTDEEGKKNYVNQMNIGYFTGALILAIKKTASRQSRRTAIARDILANFLSNGANSANADSNARQTCGLTIEILNKIIQEVDAKPCHWPGAIAELSFARDLTSGDYMDLAGDSEFEKALASLLGVRSYLEALEDGCR